MSPARDPIRDLPYFLGDSIGAVNADLQLVMEDEREQLDPIRDHLAKALDHLDQARTKLRDLDP